MSSNQSDRATSGLFKEHISELTFRMPPHLKTRILEDLIPEPGRNFPLLRWWSFGGGAIAACFSLLMVFQLGKMSAGHLDQIVAEEVVSSHVRSLMVGHISDVVSTDQHTVKPWFEGKIDFAPKVKDFPAEGFPLVGGRLDYIENRPAAALVYKFGQHFINVFQYPAAIPENKGLQLQVIRGYQVFSCIEDGTTYWFVSDVNAADLQRFIKLWL